MQGMVEGRKEREDILRNILNCFHLGRDWNRGGMGWYGRAKSVECCVEQCFRDYYYSMKWMVAEKPFNQEVAN